MRWGAKARGPGCTGSSELPAEVGVCAPGRGDRARRQVAAAKRAGQCVPERDREGETRRNKSRSMGQGEHPMLAGTSVILSTSGTTAAPKGVVLGHAGRSGSPARAHARRISCRASASTAWDLLPCLRIHARAADESPARRSTPARDLQDAAAVRLCRRHAALACRQPGGEGTAAGDAGQGRGLKLMTVENRFDRARSASASLLTETNDR